MKITGFYIRKNFLAVIVLAVICCIVSTVVFSYSYNENYSPDGYEELLESLDENEDYYDTLKAELSDYEEKNNEIISQINDYINTVQTDGKAMVVLPDELADSLVYGDTETDSTKTVNQAALTFLVSQLEPENTSLSKIEERVEGYSRNARRGVNDEYSLTVAKKLIEDYTEISESENTAEIYDTRAANALVEYLTEDKVMLLGIYLILFHIFSSELQSRRFQSFCITKTGANRFTLQRALSGYALSVVFCLIYMVLMIVLLFFKGSNTIHSFTAPMQYLNGFELSAEKITIGEYFLMITLIKIVYAVFCACVIMLISYLSKRNLTSGILSLAVVFLPEIIGFFEKLSATNMGKFLSCNFVSMTNDINYIKVFGSPIKIYLVYTAVLLAFSIVLTAALCAFAGKRRASLNV